MIPLPPATARDLKVMREIDGHWCYDWDGLAVSAWTPEYQACHCYDKSRVGKVCNWLFMLRFNLQERIVRRNER